MLFMASYYGKIDVPKGDVEAKARKWWNDGECPEGLKLLACYRPLSSDEPAVMVFEAENTEDIARLISYWHEWDFEVRPASDEMAAWRAQGMNL